MKFILNENKKFLLEERFILQEAKTLEEASIAEVAQKWTAQLSDTFTNTKEVLKKYYEFAGNPASSSKIYKLKAELDKAAEEVTASLELPATEISAEHVKVKAELSEYIKAVKKVTEIIKDSTDDNNEATLAVLPKRIAKLEAIHGKTSWKATDLDQLANLIAWIAERLAPVFEEAVGIPDSKIEKFKANCKECLELINTVQGNLPTDFSKLTAEDLRAYKELIQKVLEASKLQNAEKVTRIAVIRSFTTIEPQVQALKDAYTQLSKSSIIASQVTARNKTAASLERTVAGMNEEDWQVKYANAVNKETVIEEFIYTTWDNTADASRVLQIKKAVTQECESFGFKPSDVDGKHGNPFIQFISNVYLKYNVRPEAYNAIHNLVANGTLKGQDLISKGSLGKGNLVFCKDLYKLEAPVIKLYLRKQASLLKAANKPDIFTSIPEMVFNILYQLPEITSEPLGWPTNLKLNTLAAIEELEAKWIGAVSEVPLDPNDKPETRSTTDTEILKQIADTKAASKLLVTFAIKFSSNDEIVNLVKSCTEAKQLMDQTTTLAEIQKLVASVEKFYKIKDISAAKALSLTKSILESDRFNLTTE